MPLVAEIVQTSARQDPGYLYNGSQANTTTTNSFDPIDIDSWRQAVREPGHTENSSTFSGDIVGNTLSSMPTQFGLRRGRNGSRDPMFSPASPPVPPSYHTIPPYNRADENEPLLPQANGNEVYVSQPLKSKLRSQNMFNVFLYLLAFLVIVAFGLQSGYTYANWDIAKTIYNPVERDRIQRDWQHQYADFKENIRNLTTQRDAMQHEWKVANNRLTMLRQDIARERQSWNEERTRWEEERKEHEREGRERMKKYIQWSEVRRDQEPCVAYGTARYQAHLEYTPPGWDKYSACKETPVNIHGKDVIATECRHVGDEMVGVWIINFEEPSCKPWWRETSDQGCVNRQSGIHRYEAHLEGYLQSNEFKNNWAEMCSTTPYSMLGQTYKSPTECLYKGRDGVYGLMVECVAFAPRLRQSTPAPSATSHSQSVSRPEEYQPLMSKRSCSVPCYKEHQQSTCTSKAVGTNAEDRTTEQAPSASTSTKDHAAAQSLDLDKVSASVPPVDGTSEPVPGSSKLRPLTSLKWPYVPEESAFPDPLKRDDPQDLQLRQYEAIATSGKIREILSKHENLPALLTSIDELRGAERELALQKALGVTPPDIDDWRKPEELSEDVLALRALAEAVETAIRGGNGAGLGLSWGDES
ncbi:hypothetical protein NP233_g12112 [Leucocoprinus birnbaumii]|uniref:Uncharacterized protein n=1 Tax=Leucocoprinus birnbaumii TaxID=56174 RepID=A0AAD5VFJ9_9AGAR|nr:hypothetical protein NP233_g12112 [Leucocoprinus birnbaumii]